MSRSRRSWWLVYAACALGALFALVWISALVLSLERSELDARAGAAHQETVRLALWRMDSWLAPHLARESARPWFEYSSFHPQERSYTRLLNRIEPGEILTPSPLLTGRFDFFRLHFQIDPDDTWSSPSVPTGNLRDLAEASVLSVDELERSRSVLERLAASVAVQPLRNELRSSETGIEAILLEAQGCELLAQTDPQADQILTQEADLSRRVQTLQQNVGAYEPQGSNWMADEAAPAPAVTVGQLVPLWLPGPDPELCCVRRVRVSGEELLQGFLIDWPRVRTALLEQAADMLPGATLVPAPTAGALDDENTPRLATIPATLSAACAPPALTAGLTPARGTLLTAWLAALAALIAVGVTLHASIAWGEQRSRFASAVTHELRTPLTTFRMYSEMLATGMVREESDRTEYLHTLHRESDRLAHLVENVLAYARLEDGRRPLRREPTTVGLVLDRALPVLERRCAEADVALQVEAEPDVRESALSTDAEAVGQILFNLVDNACKYGRDPDRPRVVLTASREGSELAFTVRDFGPGISSDHARAIFAAFDRGGRDPSDPNPGIGLGLALARALARDLTGELRLRTASTPGACFSLSMPAAG